MNVLARRVLDTPEAAFKPSPDALIWGQRDPWPASWVCCPKIGPESGSSVTAYRLTFDLERDSTFRIYVTADQRYWLYVDGKRIGSGSERGSINHWYFETYELQLSRGRHTFSALTWWIAENIPWAQATVRPAFMLASPDEALTPLVSTGLGNWQARNVSTVRFLDPSQQLGRICGAGARIGLDHSSWEAELSEEAEGWQPVEVLRPGNNGFLQYYTPRKWVLTPARLPEMPRLPYAGGKVAMVLPVADPRAVLDPGNEPQNLEKWQKLLDGGPAEAHPNRITIPPATELTLLIDLNDYVCGYYAIEYSRGAGSTMAVDWAERLSLEPDSPVAAPERLEARGRYFVGMGDECTAAGGDARLEPLWWLSGRWMRVRIRTQQMPLTLRGIRIEKTGFPLNQESSFKSSDPDLEAIGRVALNTLRACAHETYMDCPYWEQLQYLGDTRLQALITYTTSTDSRLPRKALEIFRHSIGGVSPFPASAFPSTQLQIIPPFSLWYICMIRDFAEWRGDKAFIRTLMPLAWSIIDNFLLNRSSEGLIISPKGWNFVDAPSFDGGEPPGAHPGGVNGTIQWQAVLALDALSELSGWLGEPERTAFGKRMASELAAAAVQKFWSTGEAALAEDPEHSCFSEHSLILAILSGRLSETLQAKAAHALKNNPKLIRASVYFSHYLCQAYHRLGDGHALLGKIKEWKHYIDRGLMTFPEHGLEGRSDCHAWSAHPLYHLHSAVAGVRPGTWGFGSAIVEPCLGPLSEVSTRMPHPDGEIELHLKRSEGGLRGFVKLPPSVPGIFKWDGRDYVLQPGLNDLDCCLQGNRQESGS